MRLTAKYVRGPASNIAIAVFLILFSCRLFASPLTTEINYQHGEHTTEEEIVSGQDNLDYTYDKYKLRVKGGIASLDYTLGYSDYRRRYEELAGFNNNVRDVNLRVQGGLNSIKGYFYYGYKDKDYASPAETLGFVQDRFGAGASFFMRDIWKGDVSFGLSSYNFPKAGSRDRDKYYGQLRLEKYFDGKNTVLWGRSKVQYTDYEKKDSQGEAVNSGGIRIRFPARIISGISLKGELGERATIELEEEDDLDYSYWEYEVKFQHDPSDKIGFESYGGKTEREYTGARYDSGGSHLGLDGKFYILKTAKKKLYLKGGWQYKEREYTFLTDASYNKHTVHGSIMYSYWKNWSLDFSMRAGYYDYQKEDKDKNLYSIGIAFSRYLFKENAVLDLGYRYQYKDNLHKNNIEQNSFDAGFRWMW